jgi:pimeloyl-ACP methyl ester carboxylesterase
MNHNHHPLTTLQWPGGQHRWIKGSRALLSTHANPPMAVILVHGWRGDAGSTWEAFPRALRSSSKAATVDAFFFQYPSTKESAAFCAAPFAEFLLDLLRRPSSTIVNPSLPRGEPSRLAAARYERVILVGHSMGAAVARSALLELDRDDLSEADRARLTLLLFAPAHKGATIPLLIQSGFGIDFGAGKIIGAALTIYYRSLRDLAEKSGFVEKLEAKSATARERRLAQRLSADYLRAHVYHAQGDKTVIQDPFDDDYRFHPVMDKNHREICKPGEKYRDPVSALEALLS